MAVLWFNMMIDQEFVWRSLLMLLDRHFVSTFEPVQTAVFFV